MCVLDKDESDLEFRAHPAEELRKRGGLACIHAGRGFVEEQEVGLEREGAGDFELPLEP